MDETRFFNRIFWAVDSIIQEDESLSLPESITQQVLRNTTCSVLALPPQTKMVNLKI